MKGYFVQHSIEDITDLCLKGLLIHDFGSNIISCNLGNIDEITSIKALKYKLFQAIKAGTHLYSSQALQEVFKWLSVESLPLFLATVATLFFSAVCQVVLLSI